MKCFFLDFCLQTIAFTVFSDFCARSQLKQRIRDGQCWVSFWQWNGIKTLCWRGHRKRMLRRSLCPCQQVCLHAYCLRLPPSLIGSLSLWLNKQMNSANFLSAAKDPQCAVHSSMKLRSQNMRLLFMWLLAGLVHAGKTVEGLDFSVHKVDLCVLRHFSLFFPFMRYFHHFLTLCLKL